MPRTRAGSKVLGKLRSEYGPTKGTSIYYALQVEGKGGKGKHRWEGAKPGGTLAKARHTFMSEHKRKRLTTKERNRIPKGEFAGPDRSYPIPDKSHARNALSRVSANGSPAVKARVRNAVHRRFPGIGKKKGYDQKTFDKMRHKAFGIKN